MRDRPLRAFPIFCIALALVLALPAGGRAASKIVCWKDASGKTLGCGDTVPPEYRGAATKQLDSHGVTRKTTESAADAKKRRAEEQEAARQRAEEEKRLAEQRRRDAALIATFSDSAEIDAKRDREIQTLDFQIKQQRTALKTIADRHNGLEKRKAGYEKSRNPPPATLAADLARTAEEKHDMEESIAAKEKEKEELRRVYGAMKVRYRELRGEVGAAAKN